MINQLTVEWTEAGVCQNQTIQDGQPSKNQGTVRIDGLVFTHQSSRQLVEKIRFLAQVSDRIGT